MDKLNFEKEENTDFELVLQPRDAGGEPLGKKKSIKTNSAFKMWRFWMNNQGKPPKRKGSKNSTKKQRYKEVLPRGTQAENLVKEAATYAENQQREREETKDGA